MPLLNINIMINEVQFVTIKTILSRITRNKLLQHVSLEAAIQYTIDFIGIMGLPKMYLDKEDKIKITDYRGQLPCDVVSIKMVKYNNKPLTSMTETFKTQEMWQLQTSPDVSEHTFKTQNDIIFTSFKEGVIDIAYRAIPIDANGYPMIPDNSMFQLALQEYITMEEYNMLFAENKITANVLKQAESRYYTRALQVQSEFIIPSPSEMENITRMWNSLIAKDHYFDNSFRDLSKNQYIKNH